MLRPTGTNISVITNFGCKTNCWYCIWKTHPLKGVQLDTDWDKMDTFLKTYQSKGKVSVSGGGDCLHHYSKYKPWWDKFLGLCEKYNLLVDVHSRERFFNRRFWSKTNRCVVSSDCLWDDYIYFIWLIRHTKLRVVHVVTRDTTEQKIKDFLTFSKWTNCQLTLKQLSVYNDSGNYGRFKKMFPQVYCLDEGDYNIYYMPDNMITTNFMDPKEGEI